MEEVPIRVYRRGPHPLPVYATGGAVGADIHAWIPEGRRVLQPGERTRIATGIYLAIPEGYEVQVRPRSGLAWRRGLTLLNTPGTIDPDYRGEIQLLVINLSDEPQVIEDGMRIAQLVVVPVVRARWVEVERYEDLDLTARGAGGFGHTGV